MGFRTIVVLYNDEAHKWQNDPTLGRQIMHAAHHSSNLQNGGGRVAECVHADNQTLAVIDNYMFTPIASGRWHNAEDSCDIKLKLLKIAAAELGFNLTKKRSKE